MNSQTIGDLLMVYSSSDQQILIGKICFFTYFHSKNHSQKHGKLFSLAHVDSFILISLHFQDLDVAVLCKDMETQHYLFSTLQAINLNCDHAGSYIDREDTFGVIVKISKAGNPVSELV